MPFTVTQERLPRYIRFNVCGPASLKNYFDLIDEAAKQTVEQGHKAVLCDLTKVIGRLGFTDQFFIGEVVAQKLQHLEKLASLVADDPASYNSPKVASRLGLNIRTFDSEAEAVAWLQE